MKEQSRIVAAKTGFKGNVAATVSKTASTRANIACQLDSAFCLRSLTAHDSIDNTEKNNLMYIMQETAQLNQHKFVSWNTGRTALVLHLGQLMLICARTRSSDHSASRTVPQSWPPSAKCEDCSP